MRSTVFSSSILSTAMLALGGCAGGPTAVAEVPASLKPPAGEVMFVEALASGVQIYECALKPGQPSAYQWVFRAPEATLADRSGRVLGKHYAGPTWESTDGSCAVGALEAMDPGPNPSAIPWLLLRVKSTAGPGTLSQAKHVQRVNTVGGAVPSESCGAGNASRIARVPYTATYYFYRNS